MDPTRVRAGLSQICPRSTPSSASSRPARRPTSTWSTGGGLVSRGTLLAAKRYRPAERRMFHRDAGYTEGRRVRRSRETRAMARRTEFGRELLAGQWAAAEFSALSALWPIEAPVPYPVQLSGTELMLEFIGDRGRYGGSAARAVPGFQRGGS